MAHFVLAFSVDDQVSVQHLQALQTFAQVLVLQTGNCSCVAPSFPGTSNGGGRYVLCLVEVESQDYKNWYDPIWQYWIIPIFVILGKHTSTSTKQSQKFFTLFTFYQDLDIAGCLQDTAHLEALNAFRHSELSRLTTFAPFLADWMTPWRNFFTVG